jgi:hypothetical protein
MAAALIAEGVAARAIRPGWSRAMLAPAHPQGHPAESIIVLSNETLKARAVVGRPSVCPAASPGLSDSAATLGMLSRCRA